MEIEMDPTIKILSRPCPFCGRQTALEVSQAGYAKWQKGTPIGDALPESSADWELLTIGTCGECRDRRSTPGS